MSKKQLYEVESADVNPQNDGMYYVKYRDYTSNETDDPVEGCVEYKNGEWYCTDSIVLVSWLRPLSEKQVSDETIMSNPNSTNAVPVKHRTKTQQGFSQHILELNEEDAKIYTDLLDRNKLWWADVTNSKC